MPSNEKAGKKPRLTATQRKTIRIKKQNAELAERAEEYRLKLLEEKSPVIE